MNHKEFACGKRGKNTVIWLSPQYDNLIYQKFGYTPGEYKSKEGYRFRVPENTQEIRRWLTQLKITEMRRKANEEPEAESEEETEEETEEVPVESEAESEEETEEVPVESEEETEEETGEVPVESEAESEEETEEVPVESEAESEDIEIDDSDEDQEIAETESLGVSDEDSMAEMDTEESVNDSDEESDPVESQEETLSASHYSGSECETTAESEAFEEYTMAVEDIEKSLFKAIRHLLADNPDVKSARVAQYLQYVIDMKISRLK